MNFALIILAAGQSRRFGDSDKLLAPFGGEPLIVATTRRVMAANVPGHTIKTLVVTRPAPTGVAAALEAARLNPPPEIVTNPRASEGIGTSIAAGISGLSPDVAAAAIIPGDMPLLSARLIEELIQAFLNDGAWRPAHPVLADGSQTNPVIWPRTCFAPLMALTGDRGGKQLLLDHPPCTIVLTDPEMALDIDTPHELAGLQEAVGKSAT